MFFFNFSVSSRFEPTFSLCIPNGSHAPTHSATAATAELISASLMRSLLVARGISIKVLMSGIQAPSLGSWSTLQFPDICHGIHLCGLEPSIRLYDIAWPSHLEIGDNVRHSLMLFGMHPGLVGQLGCLIECRYLLVIFCLSLTILFYFRLKNTTVLR